MTQSSHVTALDIATEGFGEHWAKLTPIGRRLFLREIARTVRVHEEKIEDAALLDSVLRALADPDFEMEAER